MRKPFAFAAGLLLMATPVVAASSSSAATPNPVTESVTYGGMSGRVTVYSDASHRALIVDASSSKLGVKLTSHAGHSVSCAKHCTFKPPFAWGSVSYRDGSKTVTRVNQAVGSEQHLPKIRKYHGKDSFVVALDQGVIRVVLTNSGDVTFCQPLDPFPGYLKFTLKNGATATCPTDKNFGFENQLKWTSLTSYDTSTGSPVKGDTLYRADLIASNK